MEEIIREAAVLENRYVGEWKKGGGAVVGYTCIATPVEILEAAGVLPYRVRALGSPDTDVADAHLSRFNCSFCRSCLQLGLTGAYDFLDGMIETNGCDHLRGMMENWNYAKGFSFFHYLKVPHIVDEDSIPFFEEDLRLYKKAVEDRFGKAVTDDDLWERIRAQDRIRDNLRKVYELREQANPAITGAEALTIFLLATAVPTGDLELLLQKIIEARKDHAFRSVRARLLLGGAATDEIDFVKEIESLGALVVTDTLCFGARAFWSRGAGRSDGDPIKVLAGTTLGQLLCPRMFGDFKSRERFLYEAVKRARVDGVVLVHNKFCDVHGVENVALRLSLEKAGIPVLQLEKEYGARADLGRMRTRFQAFMERIDQRHA
jgi:benzoyl-CoA reductase/2-hydroxyglutaryl-CoA dehydratase subunit BcrC/BadD/HgdB